MSEPALPPPSVSIREMTAADAPVVARLSVEAFQAKIRHCIGDDDDRLAGFEAAFAEDLGADTERSEQFRKRTFVAESQSSAEVVAMVHLLFSGDDLPVFSFHRYRHHLGLYGALKASVYSFLMHLDAYVDRLAGNECVIDQLCVDERWRGRGIGSQILAFVDQLAIDRALSRISLYVVGGNERAKTLYEARGFALEGTYHYFSFVFRRFLGIPHFHHMVKAIKT